ncbi:MAG: large conductance mechanosensitive channel protein MscL [Prevotella sp.]|jgi:large conductance mechanosensitive channel|nr:large conductance mechanosensitive channel protein MscL [Prevotella sp.]
MAKFIQEFKDFAVKGNAIDMAVGVIIGGAFGKIVTSIVNDLMMPVIGRITGGIDFKDLFVNLGEGSYATLAQAQEAGAPVFAYGNFLQNVVDFVIIALCVFLMVKGISKLKRTKKEEEDAAAPAEPSEEVTLLREIRDALKK